MNNVGYFFSSMFGGADAVRPRVEPSLSSRDYRGLGQKFVFGLWMACFVFHLLFCKGRLSGMGNVKGASQFKAQMPASS